MASAETKGREAVEMGVEQEEMGPRLVWEPQGVDHELVASIRPFTAEEAARQLEVAKDAREFRERMRAERGGRLVPPSWPLIREAREER